MKISPRAKFTEIFAIFSKIDFSPRISSRENTIYAVLELVNNSLRAHREVNSMQPILVKFHGREEGLRIEVLDSGGGFDPSRLPFDLSQSTETLDLNGESFQKYRTLHNNTRFGMGLYIAKRFFHDFQLEFVNPDGEICGWGNKNISGTYISLFLKTGGTCVQSGEAKEESGEMLRETVLS